MLCVWLLVSLPLLVPAFDTNVLQPYAEEAPIEHWWPCKGGDLNRTGAGPSLLTTFDMAKGPTWRWTPELREDRVPTSPLIDNERNVYIVGAASGMVLKFSPRGEEIWRYSTFYQPGNIGPPLPPLAYGIPGTPALLDASLYLLTQGGEMISVNTATGTQRWRVFLGEPTGMDTTSVAAGFGTVVAGVAPQGALQGEKRLVALETNGAVRWNVTLPSASYNIMPLLVADWASRGSGPTMVGTHPLVHQASVVVHDHSCGLYKLCA